MTPPAPPLPVPRNLPFQVSAGGSQTSIRMFDSGVGLSVAATRQKAGTVIAGALALAFGLNGPAATAAAVVIVASCSLSPLSASHLPDGDCAATVAATQAAREHAIANRSATAERLIADLPYLSSSPAVAAGQVAPRHTRSSPLHRCYRCLCGGRPADTCTADACDRS